MKILINRTSKYILTIMLTVFMVINVYGENDRTGKKPVSPAPSSLSKATSGKVGDSYLLNVNNLWMPMNNRGVFADVNVPGTGAVNGRFEGGESGVSFLFSGGFMISGYSNGQLWANAQATASLIENYLPGTYDRPQDANAVLYVVNRNDPAFGQSWQDWADAVELGADYYDGDGNGSYNPSDKNGNGLWDPDEDMPDLLGDETVWGVFHDGVPLAQRGRFAGMKPQGIEIRQTVFAFASQGAIGNIAFVRYRIKNTGFVADTLKDVYFGAWADPDLGTAFDNDLVGVDVARNAGYVYQTAAEGGSSLPCFMIDFFSGPQAYIAGESYTDNNGNGIFDAGDVPLTEAYRVRGTLFGIDTIPGAKNMGVSSFVHYKQSDPDLGDPNTHIEARNYMLGLSKLGKEIDPCGVGGGGTVAIDGEVRGGVDCATLDNRFWYSGDPVKNTGWINILETDQRQMQNTGPFNLIKDEELEIVVAYIVGKDPNSSVLSVDVAKFISDGAQFIFDNNFQAPSPGPSVEPEVIAGEDFFDLVWKTAPQVNFVNKDQAGDKYEMTFRGYKVFTYKTNSTSETVNLQANVKEYTTYNLNDGVNNLYKELGDGSLQLVFPQSPNPMDPTVYSDPETGVIRLRITEDPWEAGEKLVKGKPYYFAITGFYNNELALEVTDAEAGTYKLSNQSLFDVTENLPKITVIEMGEDVYSPPLAPGDLSQASGFSSGDMVWDVYNDTLLTGDSYKVEFFIDSLSATYSTFWKLTNTSTNTVLLDSMKQYIYGDDEIAIPSLQTEGFIVKISPESPVKGTTVYDFQNAWNNEDFTFDYLVSNKFSQVSVPNTYLTTITQANYFNGDQLKRIELRFDRNNPGKAYRYLNGVKPTSVLPSSRSQTYIYAGKVTPADTVISGIGAPVRLGEFGMWEEDGSRLKGFVDVPFTAWVDDPKTGETRQLAVGFIEAPSLDGGIPDGYWNADTLIAKTKEFIIIFNSDYDPTGNQIAYTGLYETGKEADLRGYTLPDDVSVTPEDQKIAKSPYFDAAYVVGLQTLSHYESGSYPFTNGDKIVFPVSNYPYTPEDVYTFSTRKDGELTAEEEKSLWDKVNVFPNPLYGFNVATSYTNGAPDEPFVTFSNLPEEVTIKIFSLSGQMLKTLSTADKDSPTKPFIRWDLKNESGLRVASGMYLAIVSSPEYGEKVLKFALIMPQKQLPKY